MARIQVWPFRRPAPSPVVLTPSAPAVSDEEFISALYRIMLGREPDPAGLQAHLVAMESEGPLRVFSTFYKSEEFRELRSGRASAMTEADFIGALYRILLNRDPDPVGLENHVKAVETEGPLNVFSTIYQSDEFQSRSRLNVDPGPAMTAEVRVSPDELDRLWRHVGEVWSQYGDEDAHWSVLTDDRFRSAGQTKQVLDEFYDSGEPEVDRMATYFDRAGLRFDQFGTVAEYGCGVGRTTGWLGRSFPSVRAFDISASHLRAAGERLEQDGIRNVELVHVKDRAALERLNGIDLFYSFIVLQHNPPPIILDILERAFRGLAPGGVAFFQVPTYGIDYEFTLDLFWSEVAGRKSMEMHCVPQHEIFRLAERTGMELIEVVRDDRVGDYDRFISNTFLMRKSG